MGDLAGRVDALPPVLLQGQNRQISLDTSGNARVTMGLLAGEDVVNGVFRIATLGEYETIAAGQTDQVLGTTGAAGDYLEKIIIVVATAATAATSIKDGTGSDISIMPNSPGGGIGVYAVPLGMTSTDGGWKVTTGAGASAIAVGMFT